MGKCKPIAPVVETVTEDDDDAVNDKDQKPAEKPQPKQPVVETVTEDDDGCDVNDGARAAAKMPKPAPKKKAMIQTGQKIY